MLGFPKLLTLRKSLAIHALVIPIFSSLTWSRRQLGEWAGHTQLAGNKIPQCFTFNSEALPPVGELGIPEFFGRRLHTSMTPATVEDSTAGLGQTLRTGRPLVDGLSFHGVSGLCMNSWHTGCQVDFKPRVFELLWASTTCLRPARHALGGAWCSERRRPD